MPYTAEISRSNPTAFLILIDQSYSMSEPFGGGNDSKATEAAKIVNRILTEFTIACAKGDDRIYDYFDVGVLGYGGRSVGNAFSGTLGGTLFQPISLVGENPARLDTVTKRVPDGAGGLAEEKVTLPIWVDPVTDGHTPMCKAMGIARDAVRAWVSSHPDAFPPSVINVTDGESTDGDPTGFAHEVTAIETSDGPVLLFNCHISSRSGGDILFPATADGLADQFANTLFSMSSELPTKHLELAQSEKLAVTRGSRGFAFNADLVNLTLFLEIGTRINALSAELR